MSKLVKSPNKSGFGKQITDDFFDDALKLNIRELSFLITLLESSSIQGSMLELALNTKTKLQEGVKKLTEKEIEV